MILEYEGYDVQEAASGPEGLASIEREPPDLVFMDIRMPGLDGLEALQKIRQINEVLPVVIISGHGTVSTAVEATKLGAFDFIEKPLASERVLVTIRNALDSTRLQDENRSLKRAVEARYQMVGESVALRQIWDSIKRAAPTNATVLLLGESGAGKELVARSIHRNSLRSRDRFVQVNCAAIPEELIESELFGHEKGSFTGATGARKGRFELAHGGTLFLDEIGDMDAAAQAKVLRVLETGMVTRVGGETSHKVDVRVVAATNKDLAAEVAAGRFREDLLYRLNVVEIHLPPLHERREDVPLLARHFLTEACRRNEIAARRLTPECESWLSAQKFDGNVRQLRNLMERLAILANGDPIPAPEAERLMSAKKAAEGAVSDPFADSETFEDFKNAAEKLFLERKLLENNGNIKRTAERLQMMRSNLYKKIEKHQLK
jgi:two-component system nitrogen regulation response regulator NtrX